MPILLIAEVVLAFGFMIFIHEWGHFIACRLFGIRVERFALGFGPKLWARTYGDTEYAILAIPLGGYCRPAGGDPSGESPEKMYENPPKPGEFLFASWWRRALVFLAGPVMNFISAGLIIAAVAAIGERIPIEKPILGFIPPKSLAAQAGLKAGDIIRAVKGKPVTNLLTDFDVKLEEIVEGVALTVDRGGKSLSVTLKGDLKAEGAQLGVYSRIPAVLGDVHLQTPARLAGLRPGDEVLSINGAPVSDWMELAYNIRTVPSDDLALQVKRGGQTYPVTVRRIFNGSNMAIGISPVESAEFEVRRTPLLKAVPEGFRRAALFSALFLDAVGKLVTGKMSLKDNIAGPVTILRTMYQKAAQSWAEFLNTVAMISIILCIMNLLPIPIVDGGQIILCLMEGVRRRPMSVKFQLVYQQVGFYFVIALMGLAVFNDIWGYIVETFRSQIPK